MSYSTIILILSVLLGGSVAFFIERRGEWWKDWKPYIISFGGAFILGITIFELFPSVYSHDSQYGIDMGYYIILGFLLQIILETFSGGIEHGHVHDHHHGLDFSKAFTLFIGLSIHSILEGMPLAGMEHAHAHAHDSYVWGIFVHKFPAAFALMAYLLSSGIKSKMSWLIIGLFSLMTPLGELLGSFLIDSFSIDEIYPVLVAVVTGSFLHIATVVLFEFNDNHSHSFSYKKLLMIILGLGIAGLI